MADATVPDDWLGGYIDYVVRWPLSEQWEAILRGQLTDPTFLQFWDAKTGDPTTAQNAMPETFDTNLHLQEGAMLPAGLCMMWAGPNIPDGWLLRDGSEVSRVTYDRLFAAIGTTWGDGDGTTTFNLPYAQGRVDVGYDQTDADFNTIGDFGGQKAVTLEVAEIPSITVIQNAHTHTQTAHTHPQNSHSHILPAHTHTQTAHTHLLDGGINAAAGAVARGMIAAGSGSNNTSSQSSTPAIQNASPTIASETAVNQNTTATNQNTTATNQAIGGGNPHNNLQPYGVYYPIIKT